MIWNIYRPPHTAIAQLTECLDYLSEKLVLLNTRENTLKYGDYNINLLSTNSNVYVNNCNEGFVFIPTITLPACVSKIIGLLITIL